MFVLSYYIITSMKFALFFKINILVEHKIEYEILIKIEINVNGGGEKQQRYTKKIKFQNKI